MPKNILIIILFVVLLVAGGFWFIKKHYSSTAPVVLPPWYSETDANGDPVVGVFENKLPCYEPGCEKIKFALVFYQKPGAKYPTSYRMDRIYVAKGDDRTVNEGTLTATHGMKLYPEAVLYHLDDHVPQEFRSFWVVSPDVLFILDEAGNPRVGNAAYGYALNRTR